MKAPALKPKKETNTKRKIASTPKDTFDPNMQLYWSRRRLVITLMICGAISLFAVFSFLFVAQYRHIEDTTDTSGPTKAATPDTKHYANQYWGLEFDYPGSWSQPIGSYQDGEYYFSSQPINFVNELEAGESIISLKTFNNWKNLTYSDWFKENQYLFMPKGQLSSPENINIKGVSAQKYTLNLAKPENNTQIWEVLMISRSDATKYVFALETDTQDDLKKYQPIFDSLITSLTFTKVQSNTNGN